MSQIPRLFYPLTPPSSPSVPLRSLLLSCALPHPSRRVAEHSGTRVPEYPSEFPNRETHVPETRRALPARTAGSYHRSGLRKTLLTI